MSTTFDPPGRRRALAAGWAALAWLPLVALAAAPAVAAPESLASFGRRFVDEVYNQSRPERIDAFVHPDFVDHSPGVPAGKQGPAWVREQYAATYAAFPDLRFVVDDVVTEGDKVVLRWTSRGKFTGKLGDVQGRGQEVTVQGISIFRVRDDQILESWDLVDRAAMLRQAGFTFVPPAPATGGAPPD